MVRMKISVCCTVCLLVTLGPTLNVKILGLIIKANTALNFIASTNFIQFKFSHCLKSVMVSL